MKNLVNFIISKTIQAYFEIDNEINLTKNLKKTIITIGPGSYTSLRVGASFISGLNIAKKLTLCQLSISDFLKFKSEKNNLENIAFFISSANNQNYLCTISEKNNEEYIKIDKDQLKLPKKKNIIFYNHHKYEETSKHIKQYKFTFINELLTNLEKIKYVKNSIVKPIYISNNKILN